MNSAEETRLAEDLRLLTASPADPPDLGQIERHGAQRRRRGYALRGLAALAGLAVVVATGLAVSTGRGSQPQAPAETVAFVTKRITTALNLTNFVVETRENGSSSTGPVTYWTDLRTGDSMLSQGRGAARTTYWLEQYFDRQHRVLHTDLTQINYGPRTWWALARQFTQPPNGYVQFQGGGQVSLTTPQNIAALLKNKATILGHPYVNGHRTVELSDSAAGQKILLWADARTYQVVRMVLAFPGGGGLHAPTIVANYTWAERSAALAERIDHPHIPAGFRQVAPNS